MVTQAGTGPAPALPWLASPLREALAQRHGHALLVQGPQGVGQFEFCLALAQAWLCESPLSARASGQSDPRPCGHCAGCRLTMARSHPDLLVLLPEALQVSMGWNSAQDDSSATSEKASKAKPSKEIKVDAVRAAVLFSQTTASRGQGKVVVIHPAERMNGIAANALLKTLEEPPGPAKFLLSCSSAEALLPTIRSRCQALPLALPDAAVATAWLTSHGVAGARALLDATGGQPLDAAEWAAEGLTAEMWTAFPKQIARGEVGAWGAWPLARSVDMLQKLCHDAMRLSVGASPRYFPLACLPATPNVQALTRWAVELQRITRQAEHPWSLPLAVEALALQARRALAGLPSDVPGPTGFPGAAGKPPGAGSGRRPMGATSQSLHLDA